ncbi:MAG: Type secretion system protein [Acidobacteriota bacterium]|jgi:hypothetical protein|nr:Type secretion system protein [Acidobacteriota bacterium]
MRKIAAVVVLFFVALTLHAASKPEPVVDHWFDAAGTLGDARAIQTCLEAYLSDYGHYPAAATIEDLKTALSPIYIREFPDKDQWGTLFLYEVSADGKAYTIASAGSDGKFDRAAWKAGYSVHSADDLVYRNGGFIKEWVIQRVK